MVETPEERRRLNAIRNKSRRSTHKVMLTDENFELAQRYALEIGLGDRGATEFVNRVFALYAARYRNRVLGLLQAEQETDTPIILNPEPPTSPCTRPNRNEIQVHTREQNRQNDALDALSTLAAMF